MPRKDGFANPPGQSAEISKTDKVVRVGDYGADRDISVSINSGAADSGNSPTTVLRKGLVVGKLSGGTWKEAQDASVVGPTGANITCTAGTWNLSNAAGISLSILVNGVRVIASLTNGMFTKPSEATAAELVAALNNISYVEPDDLYTASTDGGAVKLTANAVGTGTLIQGRAGGANAILGFSATGAANGTWGEYGVLLDAHNTKDQNDTAVTAPAVIAQVGKFDESNLIAASLVPNARRALIANGSRFV